MSRILIQNPLYVAMMDDERREFRGGHLLVEDGTIVSIGPNAIHAEADDVIDARGMVLLPGFINTHHHLFQTLTRNIPRMQSVPLFSWLVNHYEVWRELRGESAYISAKTGLLELMKSGVTLSTDHLYLFPQETDGKLIDEEIRAARELGIRFQPTRGSMSLGRSHGGLPPDEVVQPEDVILADMERLVAQYHDVRPGAMVSISIAPCSPFSVTTDELKRTAQFARQNDLRMHTHLAETLDEEHFCIKTFRKRPVAYLDSVGWIADNAWFAHSVHLSDDEIKLMGQRGSAVAHCPSSNMRLGSGIAPVRKLMQAGVEVGIAVDGSASNDAGNMLAEIRNAMLVSRLRPEGEWLSARDVLWMATRGGAAALGRADVGSLEVGKRADLVLLDVTGIEYAGGMTDPLAALVFNVRMAPVDWLVVEGRILIREGKSGLDEAALAREQNETAERMLNAAAKRTGIDFRMLENGRSVDAVGEADE